MGASTIFIDKVAPQNIGVLPRDLSTMIPVAGVDQGDGTGAMLVSIASGGSDPTPYSPAAGQTPATSTFVGIAAWNGTTIDALKSDGGQNLKVAIGDQFGNAALISGGGLEVNPRDNTNGPLFPTTNTPVPASGTPAVIKASGGRLFGVTITTTGVTPLVLTDGVGGTAVFATIASPAVGYYPISGGNVFSTSLNLAGSVTNPAIVAHYA